jgi:hypothetical protein
LHNIYTLEKIDKYLKMRILLYTALITISLGACTQRTICPAYQSAFIHDQEELRKKFSYFNAENEPIVRKADKTKYLIAAPVSYKEKVNSLNTVPMKAVAINVPDSLKHGSQRDIAADLDRAARSVIDSTYIEDTAPPQLIASAKSETTTYMISKDKEHHVLKYDPIKRQYRVDSTKYNVDQDNYMWYLRNELVLPDVKLAEQEKAEAKKSEKSAKRKGLFSFLKRDKSAAPKTKTKREKNPKQKDNAIDEPVTEEVKQEAEEDDDGF